MPVRSLIQGREFPGRYERRGTLFFRKVCIVSDDFSNIIRKIKQYRRLNYISQRELAKALGMKFSRYSRLEQGYQVPEKKDFEAILEFLSHTQSISQTPYNSDALAQAREEAGFSVETISAILECSEDHYKRIEAGEIPGSKMEILAILDLLHVTLQPFTWTKVPDDFDIAKNASNTFQAIDDYNSYLKHRVELFLHTQTSDITS